MPLTQKASQKAPRKSINLTIASDVIDAAKALGVNASRAAEDGISDAVRRAREEQWRRDNKDAIEAYNERINREGPAIISDWTKDIWKAYVEV